MADPKSKALKGGLNIAKRLLADEQPYVAGVHYADPLSPATTRLSEALGNVGAEGKTLNFTEADRSRVFGTNRGGVGFSGLQHYSEPHKQAGTSWGFGNKTTAEKKIRQNKPNESLWTTFVGAPDQHKSNTVVIQDAINDFHNAVKSGKVHPAQIKLMNERLRNLRDENSGALLFDQAFDLTDPQALSQATSFARRSGIGDVLLGEGVKGGMRRRAFKDEHGDQPWNNAGNMEALLKRETDPDLVNANTYDVGNRLFTMEGDIVHRPDLNIAFPWQTTGHDLGIKYELTPKEVAMRDWMKQYEGRLNKRGEPSPVSYMDLARNQPSQFVSEDYLKFLQKLGYKEGGEVNMAGGGGAFKRLEFTEDDSPVQVGLHANKMGDNQNAGVMANLDMKSAGRLGVGSNISSSGSEMRPSTMVNYSNNVGDLGLNANVMKPMDVPNDVLMTNVMASYPVGSGRLTAGMHGSRMDGTHRINAHSLGYNAPLSGGNLNINVNKPVEGKPMIGAQYNRSFDTGGKVKAGVKVFKRLFADDMVNGMRIREDIPNTSSIGASLSDYSTHGLQEVPMSAFETVGKPRYRSVQEEKRTKELARQIQENKELNPLIVVKDAEGHYILEGGHRFDALRELGIDSFPALMVHDLESLGTVAKADGGKIVRGLGQLGKRLLSDEQVAGQAIGKAAESAGMKAPVTANKPLTDIQDFHTSLMDSVRARAMDAQKQMDSWDYKYAPGQFVFTEHGAKNNLPPLKILEKSRHGWNIVREDPNNPLSKKVIDPETGKAKRTPYEPGYRVRREFGPEDWSEFVIPESAIKGDVEMAMGGLAHMAPGGLLKGMAKVGKRLVADPTESALMSVRRGERMADDMGGNNIMKDVGGNWMSGNVEKAVSPLRQKLDAPKSLASTASYDPSENLAKIEKIWTPELIAEKEKHLPRIRTAVEEAKTELRPKAALNNWVDRNLTNYIKKQMATQNDPIRLLGEEGITHLPPNTRMPPNMSSVVESRKMAGFPEPVGKSPLAQTWEAWADKPIGFDTVGVMENIGKGEPWMEKADKFTRVHGIAPNYERHMFTDLGFDHIVDVLKADLASGRIRPEQLNKVSIEDAVRRTHQYNEEMAKKMEQARLAEIPPAIVHKEYPQGYKWVQLDKPGQFAHESDVMGHSVRGYEPPEGHPDWIAHSGDEGSSGYGHRGWEGIKSGQAKIYSLRDPKGQAHVTVEVMPSQARTNHEEMSAIYDKANSEANAKNFNDYHQRDSFYANRVRELHNELLDKKQAEALPRIAQIKGKQNTAPNEEYLPYVQDFIKSGNWDEVGDISNAGLMDVKYMTNPETYKKYLEQGLKVPNYATEKELEQLHNEYLRTAEPHNYKPPEGMANGGGAFKTIDWEPHFDGGGIASQEFVDPFADARKEPLLTKKDWETIKRNAPREYELAKQHLKNEATQLGTVGGIKDFALRTGAQFAGGIPDLANLGLMGVDALADTNLSSEKPWFGSEQYIDAMHKAGMLGEHEFPVAEVVAGFLSPVAIAKKGLKLYKVAKATKELPKKQSGGLTAMKQ
jgi:hypothetical protein